MFDSFWDKKSCIFQEFGRNRSRIDSERVGVVCLSVFKNLIEAEPERSWSLGNSLILNHLWSRHKVHTVWGSGPPQLFHMEHWPRISFPAQGVRIQEAGFGMGWEGEQVTTLGPSKSRGVRRAFCLGSCILNRGSWFGVRVSGFGGRASPNRPQVARFLVRDTGCTIYTVYTPRGGGHFLWTDAPIVVCVWEKTWLKYRSAWNVYVYGQGIRLLRKE